MLALIYCVKARKVREVMAADTDTDTDTVGQHVDADEKHVTAWSPTTHWLPTTHMPFCLSLPALQKPSTNVHTYNPQQIHQADFPAL